MIDFKPIEEFTFDDCVNSIKRHNSEGMPIDVELQTRYDKLLSTLKSQEKTDFSNSKTIDSLERYIKKYTSLNGANNYKPQYLQQAKNEILRLKGIRQKKQTVNRISIIVGILAVIVSIIYIGYRPATYLSVSEATVEFSKGSGYRSLKIRTDAPYYNLYDSDLYSWLNTSIDGDSIEIKVERNETDTRTGTIVVTAYPTFFGANIDCLKKKCRITVKQEDGHASYLNVSKDNISFYPEGDTESLYVSTDGTEWDLDAPSRDWLSVYKDGSYVKIRAEENTDKYSRSASIRLFSDNIEKYISISQSAYEKDAGISEISMNEGTGNVDMKLRVDYYTQGYGDEDLYVFLKIYSDKTGNVWYRNYERIYPTQSQSESYRTFTVRASTWHGKYGDNTIYACISRHTDGSSPICSFEQGFNVRSNR